MWQRTYLDPHASAIDILSRISFLCVVEIYVQIGGKGGGTIQLLQFTWL